MIRATSGRPGSTVRRGVQQVAVDADGVARRERRDVLATEEPFEIRVGVSGGASAAVPVAVTMRTPGADFDLAAGFLHSEGVISTGEQVREIRYCVAERGGEQRYNTVTVLLAPGTPFDPARLQRNFYTTSSCGVCGKASIEAVLELGCPPVEGCLQVRPEVLVTLPSKLREAQTVFDRTGGLHAAGCFTAGGDLLRIREDVGRHNALDKVVGAALLAGEVPLGGRIVLVSGRLSFELVQKAARAGVALLAGVSAPSSLAAEFAQQAGMTLVGFLRGSRFNVYTGAGRIAAAQAA